MFVSLSIELIWYVVWKASPRLHVQSSISVSVFHSIQYTEVYQSDSLPLFTFKSI